MERKTWLTRPGALTPNAGETLAQWEARVAAYNTANPGALTPLDAPDVNDLEDRVEEGIEAAVVNEAANVKDPRFAGGAVGDAANNDQPAFAAAIAAAIAAPKGRVFVPPGTYDWNDPTTATSDTFVMEGSGSRRAIIEMDAQAADILTVTPTTAGGESNSGRITGIKFRQNNNAARTDGKAGLVLNGMRHFTVEDCDFDSLDIGMDLRGNCFGTRLTKITNVASRMQVGIILRGATPLTGGSVAGSGSDITMMDCWVGGRMAAVWMEPNAGGYHFFTGQLKGGIEVGVQQDDYGSVTMGRGYDQLATTTADVDPGATTIPVSAAETTNFFSSSSLVIGANHRVTYTGRDTPGLQLTGVGGVTSFIPSGTPIYLRGVVSAVNFLETSWEGSSHRHAIRAYNQIDGLTLDGCSINSNGANRIMQIIKGTDCQLSVISFRRVAVRGTFTGTVPLDLQNLSGSWDIQEDQPNVYQPATFNGVSMNFQTKPMTEWSAINSRVRASFGDNVRWMGRTFRWNGTVLESHTDSSASTGWLPVVGTDGGSVLPNPQTVALGSMDQEERAGLTPVFDRLTQAGPLADEATVAGDLYIPQLIKVPDGASNPYAGEPYRIYHSTDHSAGAGGIYLLTAATIDGPYTDRGLLYQDTVSGNQTETAWAVYNETEGIWFLYYQQNGVSGTKASQVTCLATSPNGVDTWTRVGVVMDWPGNTVDSVLGASLHSGYLRVMRDQGMWFGYTLWMGTDYGEAGMWWSRDGRTWILDGRALHHGQEFHDDNGKRFLWNGAQVIYWKGRRQILGTFTEYLSGSAGGSPLGSFAAPLADNLRTALGSPTFVFPTAGAGAWEGGSPTVNIGSVYSEGGKIYALYKTGTGVGLAVAE